MQLTTKLIGHLNRVFDKSPGPVLALRLDYDGTAMAWAVSDGVLTTTVTGGTGAALTVDLSGHTVATLAAHLAAQTGYSVPYAVTGETATLSALALIDGTGDPAQSNGDHLYAFTSVVWAYLNAQASELTTAQAAIVEMLLQMAATTASDTWVDEHGSYYGINRADGEGDVAYAGRMIAEIIRPRGNGVAIADALCRAVGAVDARVTDYDTLTTAGDGTQSYGLFDAEVDVDVDSELTQPTIEDTVSAVIEAMRDAGTHLRKLRYIRSATLRSYRGAVCMAGHSVTVEWGGWTSVYDGSFTFDGSRTFSGIAPS